MSEPKTTPTRPLPSRPPTGLLAWQSTMGHISSHFSPDAILKIQATTREARVQWSAVVSWGEVSETVNDQPSLAATLRELWRVVSHNHGIYERLEDAIKGPYNYDDTEWIDLVTQESLQRLIWVTQIVFPGDWLLLIIYQPIESPAARMQMRLIAQENTITVGGHGPALVDACRALFRNAAPYYGQVGKVGEL